MAHNTAPPSLCLAGLSALQRLVLSDCLLMEQEPLGEIPDQLVS